jgi:Fe-S oxidoreductase
MDFQMSRTANIHDNDVCGSEAVACGRLAALRPYHVELEDNLFSVLRSLQGLSYEDALIPESLGPHHGATSIFWPGCTLSSYSAELTEATYGFLKERGFADGMTTRCCGNILRSVKDRPVFEAYGQRLVGDLSAAGVKRLIAACPGCYHNLLELQLSDTPGGIEVLALPEVLISAGIEVPSQYRDCTVCVHDSCPDRTHGVFAESLRALVRGLELRETAHNREHSHCCGMGKLLSINHPEISESMIDQRLSELSATGADLVLSACFTCTSVFQELGTSPRSLHYLELFFDMHVNWPEVYRLVGEALERFERGASFEADN